MGEFRIGSVVRVKEGIRGQCKYRPGLDKYFDRDLIIVGGDPSNWEVDIGGPYTFHESAIELWSNPDDEDAGLEVSDATAILDF